MKALRIDINGKMQTIEITGKTIEQQNECIHDLLGGYFECVHLSADAVMLVDDEGLIKNLAVNAVASRIADHPFLFGTALIVGLMETYDGDVFCDCPERFLRACLASFEHDTNKSKREHLKRILQKPFTVLPKSAAFIKPPKGTFNDPAFRKNSKCMKFITFYNFNLCTGYSFNFISKFLSGIASVSK